MIQRHAEIAIILREQSRNHHIQDYQPDEDASCRPGEKPMDQEKRDQSVSHDTAHQQQVEKPTR